MEIQSEAPSLVPRCTPPGLLKDKAADSKRSNSLLKNREMEGFLFLDDGCCGGAVELDVIF